MEIFHFLQNYLFYLSGVSRWNSFFGKIWYVASKFVFFCIGSSLIISVLSFCIFTAQTFSEYVEGMFYIMFCSISILWYIIFLIYQDEYKVLIFSLDTFIRKKSEFSNCWEKYTGKLKFDFVSLILLVAKELATNLRQSFI